MNRRHSKHRSNQQRKQNLLDRITPVLYQSEAMGFRKKRQGLRGQIQFVVDEHVCFAKVVYQGSAADFAMLFFYFELVIGVGIVALNHYQLRYHEPDHYTSYISML